MPPTHTAHDSLVIGAGLAGLACARRLADHGRDVCVLDKGRGLGGRLATRRFQGTHVDGTPFTDGQADHGARVVHPRTAPFAAWLARAEAAGSAAFWPEAGGYVGLPGMSGLVAPLAHGLQITTGTEAISLQRMVDTDVWCVTLADGGLVHARHLVVAIPQPQARQLLDGYPQATTAIAGADMAPAYVAIAGFDQRLPTDLCHARWDHGVIGAVQREAAKPGRTPAAGRRTADTWVIEATPDWAAAHINLEKPQGAAHLMAALGPVLGLTGALPQPVYLAGHRWRYARTARALGQPYVHQPDLGLGLCGDWCLGAEADCAFTSGQALADAMLAAKA